MLTSLSALLLLLSDALRAVTAYYNTLALRLYWSSAKNLNRINEEIIRLESAGDPRHRDRLGLLRLQGNPVLRLAFRADSNVSDDLHGDALRSEGVV